MRGLSGAVKLYTVWKNCNRSHQVDWQRRRSYVAKWHWQTYEASMSSTHLRNQWSAEIRRKLMMPSAAVPHIHVGLRFCKKLQVEWYAENAMRHKIGSKLRMPSAVRLYATHGRLAISLEKRRKCNLAREMQQTHDAAISSTHLRNQWSAEIRRKLMMPWAAVPLIYVALRF